jgi:hypothetical protein
MSFTEAVTVVAILLGPILAIQVSRFLEDYRERHQRREGIFKVLMATRATPLDSRHVEALNMIDIEFHGRDKKSLNVVGAWRDYLDHLTTSGSSEVWASKSRDLFVELLHKMAICLNYEFDKADIRKTSYFPTGLGQVQQLQQVIMSGLGEILSGQRGLPIESVPKVDQDARDRALRIMQCLDEIVQGKRAIRIDSQTER